MRFLLDTQVFLWLLSEPERLGDQLGVLEDPRNDLFLSAASCCEIVIKAQLGIIDLPHDPIWYIPDRMRRMGVEPLPIEQAHALGVSELPPVSEDIFDRLLVSQARYLRLVIVTADTKISRYEVEMVLV